jgi:methenyltetrahydrofolate cyclohydrolase
VFTDLSVSTFLDELASAEPVPGGGSAAAVAGALAASLVSMVCQLTIGRRRFQDVTPMLLEVLAQSEAARQRLAALAQEDTEVYSGVMAAYRMPGESAEEQTVRDQAWQSALIQAALVPMEIAELCRQVVDLALPTSQTGNPWAVSDAGVAALLGEAALRAALLSVDINLKSIRNSDAVADLNRRVELVLSELPSARDRVLAAVHERMGV